MVNSLYDDAGDMGSISGLGRSPGVENGNPVQYSCLGNFMDTGDQWATVQGVTKSWTWLCGWHSQPQQHARQQILNVDKTALHWKKTPARGFRPREKSVSSKPPKDKLTLYLGATVAGDLKLKSMLIYYSKMAKFLGSLRMFCLLCLCYKWNKPWMTVHLFTTWFTAYFKPTAETYCSERKKKKISFKILLLIDSISGHPRGLREINNEINVVFMPANKHPFCIP